MNMAIKEHLGKSQLFDLLPIDLPDNIEHGMYLCHDKIRHLFGSLNFEERQSLLRRHFRLLHSITSDGWAIAISQLRYFTFSRFYLLKSGCKSNLVDLVDKIVSLHGQGADGLIVGLLRQIRPGDHGSSNRELTGRLIALLTQRREWLMEQPGVIPFVFYSMARIAAEEGMDFGVQKGALQLCDDLLRNKYRECVAIGRDFVRIVQAIAHLEPIKVFWSWFIKDGPEPNSAPIQRVLTVPTPKKYIACRLTPLMETEIIYMMEQVKTGRQSFYENWFQEAHLPKGPGDDPNALITDLIRYIVAVYHPSNAILASNVVQRWSLITWLYRLIIHEKAAFDALLAVYLDWFFFEPTIDSIMNVEPGCLVLTKGLGRLPAITLGAITYLMYYKHEFAPNLETTIMARIDLAMKICIEKGVISDLNGLKSSPILDAGMKTLVSTLFPQASRIVANVDSADPRLKSSNVSSRTSSITRSLSSSSSNSSKSAPMTKLSPELEIAKEKNAIEVDYAELLMDKIKLLANTDTSDHILQSLVDDLKQTCDKIAMVPERLRSAKELDLNAFFGSMSAKIQAMAQFVPKSQVSVTAMTFPTTAGQFNKFKLQLAADESSVYLPEATDFIDLVESSLDMTPSEQIWLWKSIVLLIESLPLHRIKHAEKCLRQSFPLIAEEHEIMVTGLQDCLLTLHARKPVIPAIFDGLNQLTSEAFQNFVEQAVLLSRND